jgi:Zn-dependent protease
MIEFSLQQLVLRLIAYGFIAGIHGLAVAATACALGDEGPRHDGRLRANPLAHLDAIGTVAGVLFSIGWIKPVAIDPAQLRIGRLGLVVTVLSGAAATLFAALALRLIRPLVLPLLSDTLSASAFALIETTTALSLWFALANLLPLPPFTGAHLVVAAVPAWRKAIGRRHIYAALAAAVLTSLGAFATLLGPAYRLLAPSIVGN